MFGDLLNEFKFTNRGEMPDSLSKIVGINYTNLVLLVKLLRSNPGEDGYL